MRKNYLVFYAAIFVSLIIGLIIRGFFGGVVFGGAIVLLPIVLIGKKQAAKAGKLIDKKMVDIVLNQ